MQNLCPETKLVEKYCTNQVCHKVSRYIKSIRCILQFLRQLNKKIFEVQLFSFSSGPAAHRQNGPVTDDAEAQRRCGASLMTFTF